MKKISALIALVFCLQLAHSQIVIPNTLKKPKTQTIDASKVKGTMYEDDNFVKGLLIDELGKRQKDYYIRYNAYTDEVELITGIGSKNISAMLSNSPGIYAKIGNKQYQRINFRTNKGVKIDRIAIKLAGNNDILLYKFLEKEFIPEKKAKTSLEKDVPAKFRTKQDYYILINETLHEVTLNKKKMAKLFPKQKKEIETYIKKEKLNLKKEVGVIALINYLDTL